MLEIKKNSFQINSEGYFFLNVPTKKVGWTPNDENIPLVVLLELASDYGPNGKVHVQHGDIVFNFRHRQLRVLQSIPLVWRVYENLRAKQKNTDQHDQFGQRGHRAPLLWFFEGNQSVHCWGVTSFLVLSIGLTVRGSLTLSALVTTVRHEWIPSYLPQVTSFSKTL